MPTKKTTTDLYSPTSQEDIDAPVLYETGTIGDDPVQAAALKADQEREDKEKADKKMRDEIEAIMKSRMDEQKEALTNTFQEIMFGPNIKDENDKKDVKSNG